MHQKVGTVTLMNAFACVWLIMSAFVWPHSRAQMTSALIVGVLGLGVVLVARTVDRRARYLNGFLAIWLIMSLWVLPPATPSVAWNNTMVALLLLPLSVPALQQV
jgi:hypothetical protein